MASRRTAEVRAEWDRAQSRDLRELPGVPRVVRGGAYGTFPERVRGYAPKAPTLDDGPTYTGEAREEVNGNPLVVPASSGKKYVVLAMLRRPWPYVGFAFDTSDVDPTGEGSLTVGILAILRGTQRALVLGSVVGGTPPPAVALSVTAPQSPFPWIAMTGIYAGARIAVYAINTRATDATVTANLWGYNAPGFGP